MRTTYAIHHYFVGKMLESFAIDSHIFATKKSAFVIFTFIILTKSKLTTSLISNNRPLQHSLIYTSFWIDCLVLVDEIAVVLRYPLPVIAWLLVIPVYQVYRGYIVFAF